MSWPTLDDAAPLHRKQLAAGALACWLWTCGLCYCERQEAKDGFIPEAVIKLLYPGLGPKQAKRLVDAGLWERAKGGYVVHDYLHWRGRRFGQSQAERGAKGGSVSSEAKKQAALEREEKKRLAQAGTTSRDHKPTTSQPQAEGTSGTPTTDTSLSDPIRSDPSSDTQSAGVRARRPDPFGDSFVTAADELPDDWEPNASNIALAAQFGLPLDDETAEYRAWCRRDKRVCGAWDADFELWLRRSKKFARERGERRGAGTRTHGGPSPEWPEDADLSLREAIRGGAHGERLKEKLLAGNLDAALARRLIREREQARKDSAERRVVDRSSPVAAAELVTAVLQRPTGSSG